MLEIEITFAVHVSVTYFLFTEISFARSLYGNAGTRTIIFRIELAKNHGSLHTNDKHLSNLSIVLIEKSEAKSLNVDDI